MVHLKEYFYRFDRNTIIKNQCLHLVVSFNFRRAMRRAEKKDFKQKKTEWSKATTTPLVSEVFETFFTDQLDSDAATKVSKFKICLNKC